MSHSFKAIFLRSETGAQLSVRLIHPHLTWFHNPILIESCPCLRFWMVLVQRDRMPLLLRRINGGGGMR